MRIFSYRNRPAHLGRYPLERLPRAESGAADGGRPQRPPRRVNAADIYAAAAQTYLSLYEQLRDGEVAPERAPIPDDPEAVVHDLKATGYFMDASMMAACELPASAWYQTAEDGTTLTPYHSHAVVVLVAHARPPEPDNLAHAWVANSQSDRAAMRAMEIATILAGYIRRLGWPARAHSRDQTDVDHARLVVRAGLGERHGEGVIAPFIGAGYETAIITTDLTIADDRPLKPGRGGDKGLAYWLGLGGTVSGLAEWSQRRRSTHLSRYPMEKIKTTADPTTLVLEDEVPRVPKRAAFFERALHGDLGAKMKRERLRFATKHPLSNAMTPLIRALVPLQAGQVATSRTAGLDDPAANARAVKSLSYYLGANLVGICEVKRFAWYSHKEDGTPIEPYHRYAIVMLIDQGHETMDGASGDDWISGGQSMRGYLRGAEVTGQVAQVIRTLGYGARSHSNADSDVLHIPLILYAGLGELSRIGELVLNPFVGPRFKSAVVTTDLPLAVDPPIDFGLQDMCAKCFKCARECPCDAIAYGDKVMFNGYEMWKPDVQRCTSYRVTNPHGSACGRCMKMCPYTNEGLLVHRAFLWTAIKLPFMRRFLANLDDWMGNGEINPVKKWWRDLEWLPDGKSVAPRGANQRGLDVAKGDKQKATQKVAYYPANIMPPPDSPAPVPVDRKAALAAALETPPQAQARHARGDPPPAHSAPTEPVGKREQLPVSAD